MFLAIIFIILGLLLLLNAMGIVLGNFWGFFWAIVLLALGIKMLVKRGRCPMCSGCAWTGKMHQKMHEKMHGECGCDHCDEEEDKS